MNVKLCVKCNDVKPLTEFHFLKTSKDGRNYFCKCCKKLNYLKNIQKIKLDSKLYYQKNRIEKIQKAKNYVSSPNGKFNRENWLKTNKLKIKQGRKVRYNRRREVELSKQKIWHAKNKKERCIKMFEWRKQNPGLINSYRAQRRAAILNATPIWLTKSQKVEISEMYKLAKELKWLNNGVDFHVDHIVPLRGEHVCGLHVPWNLQLLSWDENLKKGNKYEFE